MGSSNKKILEAAEAVNRYWKDRLENMIERDDINRENMERKLKDINDAVIELVKAL